MCGWGQDWGRISQPAAAPARVAADVGVSVATVDKWRTAIEASGVDGLITPSGRDARRRIWRCLPPA